MYWMTGTQVVALGVALFVSGMITAIAVIGYLLTTDDPETHASKPGR